MLHAADTMVGTDHVGCMTLQPDKVYLDKSLQRITGQPCFATKPDFHGLPPEFLAAYDVKGSQFANCTVIDKGQHIRGAPSVRLLEPTSAKDGQQVIMAYYIEHNQGQIQGANAGDTIKMMLR